jgi:hypothetical protein
VWCRRPISQRKSRVSPQSVVDALIAVGGDAGGSDRYNPHGYLIVAEVLVFAVFGPSVSGCCCVAFCGAKTKMMTKNLKRIVFFSYRDDVMENVISNGWNSIFN